MASTYVLQGPWWEGGRLEASEGVLNLSTCQQGGRELRVPGLRGQYEADVDACKKGLGVACPLCSLGSVS